MPTRDKFLLLFYVVILIIFTTVISAEITTAPRLKQIAQCEKELPRNQKCVLIAVPEEL